MNTDIALAEAPYMPMEGSRYYAPTLFSPSPTQPRKTFNTAYIAELAGSIKRSSQIQPILARPNPKYTPSNGQPPFEIVCGECRWRAVQLAELPGVLAIIRDLSDFDVLEIQIIENMHRNDLHPLEEAEGLQRLLRQPDGLQGYANAEELAQRLGKSRRWVFMRLELLKLCDAARAVFLDGTINASVAGLIARMPSAEQQAQATARIVQGFGGEPYSFRAAADFLHKEYMLALSKAPFDVTVIYPVAGPCGQCSKRSGASPDLFDDVKSGDMCQDSTCYAAKTSQARDAKVKACRDAGHTVLAGEAARKLMISSAYLPNGYQWLDKPSEYSTSPKPLRELFGAKTRDIVTLDHPCGEIISLVPNEAAIKMLKAKGLLKPARAPAEADEGEEEDTGEQEAVQTPQAAPSRPAAAPDKQVPRTPQQLDQLARSEGIAQFNKVLFKTIHSTLIKREDLPVKALRMLITARMDDAAVEEFQLLYETHGWELPSNEGYARHSTTSHLADLSRRLAQLSGRELGELLIETLVLPELTDGVDLEEIRDSDYRDAPTLTLAEELGIAPQLEAIEQAAMDEARAKVHAEEAQRLGLAAMGLHHG